MNAMKTITRITAISICLLATAVRALPIEQIRKQGEYLKGLITQVNLEQFKRDSALFFEFDPQFPLSGQQMFEYKKIAKALVDHANATRAEKFEERKILLGRTIHNGKAMAKSIALGLTTAVGTWLFGYVLLAGLFDRHLLVIPGLLGCSASALCAYGTHYYYRLARNSIDTINQQMRDLSSITEHAKQIDAQMNGAEEPRA